MLIPFTIPGGATVYVSGDHVEHVAAAVTPMQHGTALLLEDGTVIIVVEPVLTVVELVNGSLTTALVTNVPAAGMSQLERAYPLPVPGRVAA